MTVRHARQDWLATATAVSAKNISDANRYFFIAKIVFNSVKQNVEHRLSGHIGQYATGGVLGDCSSVDAYAFSVGYVFHYRKQFLELGRPSASEVIGAGGDDVVGVLKCGNGGVPLVVLDGDVREGDCHQADNSFTLPAGALE